MEKIIKIKTKIVDALMTSSAIIGIILGFLAIALILLIKIAFVLAVIAIPILGCIWLFQNI